MQFGSDFLNMRIWGMMSRNDSTRIQVQLEALAPCAKLYADGKNAWRNERINTQASFLSTRSASCIASSIPYCLLNSRGTLHYNFFEHQRRYRELRPLLRRELTAIISAWRRASVSIFGGANTQHLIAQQHSYPPNFESAALYDPIRIVTIALNSWVLLSRCVVMTRPV